MITDVVVTSPDYLTVLHSVSGKFATKRFSINRKTGEIKNRSYDNEKYFRVEIIELDSFADLAAALTRIAGQQHAFIIRGEPLLKTDLQNTIRRSVPNRKTGEPATFGERPRHWFCIDVDHIGCPVAIDPKTDPESAVEYVVGLLPPELHDASCWWQLSSSQSVMPLAPGADEMLSMHLWYWSETALADAELTRWAVAVNQVARYKLVGPELFRTVQAHYITRPIFFEPLKDPLVRRTGLRRGLEDSVSLTIPPPSAKRPDEPSATGFEPGIGVEGFLAQVGGPRGNRDPIKSAICSFVAIYGSGANPAPLYQAIRAALDRAVPGWREDPVGSARYGEDEHLDKLVEWARRVHGDQPAKGFLGEPPPHVVDPNIPPPIDSACEAGLPEFCDDALALLFSQAHAANLRYVALLGKWLLWADTHWFLDETLKAFDLARAICRSASARVPPRLTKLAAAVASAKTVAAVERLAKADRQHASTIDQWDRDDWFFNNKED